MKFNAKLRKKLFSFVLAVFMLTANVLPGQMITVKATEGTDAGEGAEEISLQSVREEAAASYAADKMGFDLDLSSQSFSGSDGLDYSSDAQGRAYMQVFNNLKNSSAEQTILFRFKSTAANQFIFGTGVDGFNNGKNMIFALQNGTLRFRIRNCKKATGNTVAGLQGNVGSNLNNGRYHTVAISFCPELGYAAGNVRLVIDGGSDLYPAQWCPDWKAGFNQNTDEFTKFHIGSSTLYGADVSNAVFNGSMDFITVINKGYSVQELQKITEGDYYIDPISFSDMWEAGTCKTWLFTGGTEGVADFAQTGTTRNWVGLYETNMRESGSYVVRGRFVFNTAKRGADLKQILEEYDTRVKPFGTAVVGIMIGAADYQKGTEGIPEFKTNLQAFIDRVMQEKKKPLILTPYTAVNEADQENVQLYTEAIREVVGENVKVVDISNLEANYINEDGSLTPTGHQAVATELKRAVGAPGITNYPLNELADGSYTVAKQTESKAEAELESVIAGEDSITVTLDTDSGQLEYTLTANGEVLSDQVRAPSGRTKFTITGLKPGETYRLMVYDTGRNNVKESYRPVDITVAEGAVGESQPYEGKNSAVNEKIRDLMFGERPVTYLFMGDSITHGVVTRGYDNVPQMFAKYLDEIGRTDDIVLNTGVTNATIATTLDQKEPRLTRYHPDVVMIMLGTNDTSVRGENTVTGTESATLHGISVEDYAKRYKDLIREAHKTNPDVSIVLRVPCDMAGQLDAHKGFEDKFAEIANIAADMRKEIDGLNIAVVNHLQYWRYYRDNVRNDNITTSGYGWLVSDGIHPNGRGNLAMFQQIIKELGLYVPTSELANYQYELSEWTDTSAMEAPVTQKGSRAAFAMGTLSDYANGLRNVTLTLTEADGRSISKTAEYDAEGIVTVSGLDAEKTYTAAVTGTDSANSKEVAFDTNLTKETDLTATNDEKKEYIDSLKEAEDLDLTEYPSEVQELYKAALKEIKDTYADSSAMTVDQIDAALAAIRLAQANIQKSMQAITQARENLQEAIAQVKKTIDEGKKPYYRETDWIAFTEIYSNAKHAVEDENTTAESLKQILADLQRAENMVLNPPTICPPPPKVVQNRTYVIEGYEYLVTDLAKRTVTVTGTTDANLSKIIVKDSVKLADEKVYEVTEVAKKAFFNHKKVSSVQIGINVEKIGEQAFAKCAKLKKAVIKSTRLTEIGKKAFQKDKNLKSIDIKSKVLKNVGKNAFKGTNAKLKITVPKAKYKAYVKMLAKKGQSKNTVIKKK